MWAHLGAMLAYLEGNAGPSSGYVGPSWGYVGPSWGYFGPSWGYVGPSWGLCCPILGLCWPILRPMLAHVDPTWATRSEKWEKMGRAQNPVKRRIFWPYRVGRRQGARPLSPTERRETPYGNATARGPLAGLTGYCPLPPAPAARAKLCMWVMVQMVEYHFSQCLTSLSDVTRI